MVSAPPSTASTGVGIRIGVDDVANRLIGQLLDRRHDRVRHLPRTRVHEDDPIGPDLDGDVAARATDHVKVRLHLKHLERVAAPLILRCADTALTPSTAAMTIDWATCEIVRSPTVRFIQFPGRNIHVSRPAMAQSDVLADRRPCGRHGDAINRLRAACYNGFLS